jgi:hypothetical protein
MEGLVTIALLIAVAAVFGAAAYRFGCDSRPGIGQEWGRGSAGHRARWI